MMAVTPSGKDKQERYLRLYVGGYDLSGDSRTFGAAGYAFDEADVTGWDEEYHNFLAGHRTLELSYTAIMNNSSNQSYQRLGGANKTSGLVLAFGGGGAPAIGDPVYALPSVQLAGGVSIDGGVPVLNVDFSADASQQSGVSSPAGVLLQDADTALSATFSAGSSRSYDFGAASSNGGWAILQVIASSSGNWSIVVRHSSDDSAYSDLATFTNDCSAAGAYEIQTFSGTVNRYVSLAGTRTAGTINIIVGFVRN